MMSQSYTHHWDEIEYFELALPHAQKEPKVAGVKAGCNGCHAPLAFLAGDIPPPRPAEEHAGQRGGVLRPLPQHHRLRGRRALQLQLDRRARRRRSRARAPAPRAWATRSQANPFLQHRRVLRHLPQREGPLGPVGQGDAPRVEGEPVGQGRDRLPGLPHAAGGGQQRSRHGRRGPSRRPSASVPRRPLLICAARHPDQFFFQPAEKPPQTLKFKTIGKIAIVQ